MVGNYYDSFGNITVSDRDFSRSAFDHGAFSYDAQQRLTSGYGVNYAYDAAGRLTTYEGLATTVNNAFPAHALKNPGYSYDANGNLVTRPGQTLTWNAENQLASVTGNGVSESYTYDANGQRVRKVSNGVTTYYPNQYYEQTGATITKYHYFNGQRVSLHTNAPGGWVHYDLHSDHLGSTVLTTNQGGSPLTRQNYFAYGKYRPGDNGLQTDYRFTGQQGDATGLLYMNARYYDPQLGQFISPDTLVPDATNLFDYNRYMYARGNPMKYNDPTGHCTSNKDGSRAGSDAECWQFVDTISSIWDQHPNYWEERFKVSNTNWLEKVAAAQQFDTQYMNNELNLYLHSSSFKSDNGFISDGYTPGPVPSHPIEQFNDKVCNVLDCIAVGLDVASLALSVGGDTAIGCAVASAGTAAGVCIPAAGIAKVADAGIAVTSVTHTGDMLRQGKASPLDFYFTATTARLSIIPGVGEAAGIAQLSYDLADPYLSLFISNAQVNK